jgi:hypothetical protein
VQDTAACGVCLLDDEWLLLIIDQVPQHRVGDVSDIIRTEVRDCFNWIRHCLSLLEGLDTNQERQNKTREVTETTRQEGTLL